MTSFFSFSLACVLLVGITVGEVYAGEESGEAPLCGLTKAARMGLKGDAGDPRCLRMPPTAGSHT